MFGSALNAASDAQGSTMLPQEHIPLDVVLQSSGR